VKRTNTAKRVIFSLFAALLFLAAAEAALRTAGFRFDTTPRYMRFSFPGPNELHNIFQPDPELLWKMRPGYEFGQGFPPLNRQGFRDKDFETPKEPDSLRVACLGDSVTFGRPEAAYPDLMEDILADKLGRPVEAMNFGVPGYSSFQGRTLLKEVLREYRPDAVIIMFGWNDHWLAKGFSDAEQKGERQEPHERAGPLRSLRIYQAVDLFAVKTRGIMSPRPEKLRVPPDRYRENLASMADMSREAGAIPVLATAPSAISTGEVPDYLTHLGFVKHPQELQGLHSAYNEAVRGLAARAGVILCDLDLLFKQRGVTSLFHNPAEDIIHPNEEGCKIMANALADKLAQEF